MQNRPNRADKYPAKKGRADGDVDHLSAPSGFDTNPTETNPTQPLVPTEQVVEPQDAEPQAAELYDTPEKREEAIRRAFGQNVLSHLSDADKDMIFAHSDVQRILSSYEATEASEKRDRLALTMIKGHANDLETTDDQSDGASKPAGEKVSLREKSHDMTLKIYNGLMARLEKRREERGRKDAVKRQEKLEDLQNKGLSAEEIAKKMDKYDKSLSLGAKMGLTAVAAIVVGSVAGKVFGHDIAEQVGHLFGNRSGGTTAKDIIDHATSNRVRGREEYPSTMGTVDGHRPLGHGHQQYPDLNGNHLSPLELSHQRELDFLNTNGRSGTDFNKINYDPNHVDMNDVYAQLKNQYDQSPTELSTEVNQILGIELQKGNHDFLNMLPQELRAQAEQNPELFVKTLSDTLHGNQDLHDKVTTAVLNYIQQNGKLPENITTSYGSWFIGPDGLAHWDPSVVSSDLNDKIILLSDTEGIRLPCGQGIKLHPASVEHFPSHQQAQTQDVATVIPNETHSVPVPTETHDTPTGGGDTPTPGGGGETTPPPTGGGGDTPPPTTHLDEKEESQSALNHIDDIMKRGNKVEPGQLKQPSVASAPDQYVAPKPTPSAETAPGASTVDRPSVPAKETGTTTGAGTGNSSEGGGTGRASGRASE